jgi:hypothetical protein
MIEENDEYSAKDKGRKDLFRRTWLEQMNVKRQKNDINDELLRKTNPRMTINIVEKRDDGPPFRTLIA